MLNFSLFATVFAVASHALVAFPAHTKPPELPPKRNAWEEVLGRWRALKTHRQASFDALKLIYVI
jgi:hypothetical protein